MLERKAEEDIPKNEVEKIESVVYAMAEKFLENVEMDEIREMMRMTRLGQMLREEGREEGRKEGQKESIVQLVTRKYQLGDSPEKIAKDLLMSEEEVEEILGKVVSEKVE